MASSVFLDTHGWIALLNATEQMHGEANSLWQDLGRRRYRIAMTDWVIAETGNGLARSLAREQLTEAVERLRANPEHEIVFVDDVLLERSLDFYSRHSDKSWGLVDCASFIVMQDRGISEAFTSDRHFEQAGFTCLLAGGTS